MFDVRNIDYSMNAIEQKITKVLPQCSLTKLLLACFTVLTQAKNLQPQTNTWNSSFRLTSRQISEAGITQDVADDFQVALNFERSNNAGSLIQDDSWYQLPSTYDHTSPPPAGTVIKVEQYANTTLYTLPPTVSISRFLYMTETVNGSSVPASALVLWPFVPRKFQNLAPASNSSTKTGSVVYPVVVWAHGTSGVTQACAPSGLRNLWDDFHLPFPLALSGYAVVAPDYLGLGVANTISPYFVFPSQANDMFHALTGAQKTWSDLLSHNFVIAGHSQGGGTAWSCAQRQHQRPVDGYLGTLAASPFTDILSVIAADPQTESNLRVVGIAQGLNSVLGTFGISSWVTEAGIARLKLIQDVKACGTAAAKLFGDLKVKILQDGWNVTRAAKSYSQISDNGNRPFAGPMLVIQGTEDSNANEPVTTRVVNETCSALPNSSLHYIRYEGIGHTPVLFSGQHVWLDWIKDRFDGVKIAPGCKQETLVAVRGERSIGPDQQFFLEYNAYGM